MTEQFHSKKRTVSTVPQKHLPQRPRHEWPSPTASTQPSPHAQGTGAASSRAWWLFGVSWARGSTGKGASLAFQTDSPPSPRNNPRGPSRSKASENQAKVAENPKDTWASGRTGGNAGSRERRSPRPPSSRKPRAEPKREAGHYPAGCVGAWSSQASHSRISERQLLRTKGRPSPHV